VLTTVREKILFSKIHYLKFFAELFAKSSPPEAPASPTNQNLKAKGAVLAPFVVV